MSSSSPFDMKEIKPGGGLQEVNGNLPARETDCKTDHTHCAYGTGATTYSTEAFLDAATAASSQLFVTNEEDEHIRKLHSSGAIDHVVGSQSILSQEILAYSSPPTTEDVEEPGTAIDAAMLLTEESRDENPSVAASSSSSLDVTSSSSTQSGGASSHSSVAPLATLIEAANELEFVEEPKDPYPLPPIVTRQQLRREAHDRRMKREADTWQAQELAKCAANLAAEISASPEMAKQLLLSMALVRTNPRTPPSSWPAKGHVIPEGFFWTTYPPLESELRKHMSEYYELSVKRCQSKDQQQFNNNLVQKIRECARKLHWKFSPKFTDKILRDRIRCYFKTHIQNSKKRLRTMTKNPTKRANAKALVAHYDLIRRHVGGSSPEEVEQVQNVAEVMALGFQKLSQDQLVHTAEL